MEQAIYLDHHATTPVDERVLERMLPFFTREFGNAASRNHAFGWQAEAAVDVAREQVAGLIGASGREIVFTSGATEANNLAIFGVAGAYGESRNQIVTQASEHKAVLDVCAALAKRGFEIITLPVDGDGLLDPETVRAALSSRTALVSVMFANNEIGTVQPIGEIGAICKEAGVLFHSDASQAVGLEAVDVLADGIDLLSFSGHKLYGPKGVGALYVRRRKPRVTLTPLIYGGGHERGMRSGTTNVPSVVGLGEACRLAGEERESRVAHLGALRDRLQARLVGDLEGVHLNGHKTRRHPGNLNVSFDGVDAEALIMGLRTVAVSSGAACASADLQPSHVLRAIGRGEDLARGSVRFGIGKGNTAEEIDSVATRVVDKVGSLRRQS